MQEHHTCCLSVCFENHMYCSGLQTDKNFPRQTYERQGKSVRIRRELEFPTDFEDRSSRLRYYFGFLIEVCVEKESSLECQLFQVF